MNPNKARADRFDAVVDAYGSDSPCENRIGYLISTVPVPDGITHKHRRRGRIPRRVKDTLRRSARLLPIFRALKASLVQTWPLRAARP